MALALTSVEARITTTIFWRSAEYMTAATFLRRPKLVREPYRIATRVAAQEAFDWGFQNVLATVPPPDARSP